ncbi:hypothetical protein KDH_03350 [Dictyobacter sp. S3.2.2.5]|uniref:Uncharacterized protein n=1 Tax=Dictyobacter halimunensis TaxID=3026934 RepID=A0ABQ6FHF7_9CHLR|nr:hypothetical protein KDH_03350 [Dictyobacter sp. S3.2.2.5]
MIQRLMFTLGRVLFNVVRSRKRAAKPEKGAVSPSALAEEVERTVGIEEATRRFLISFLLPLWMIAGLLDWRHHKRTKIEATAGTHESMIHALMMGEISLPLYSPMRKSSGAAIVPINLWPPTLRPDTNSFFKCWCIARNAPALEETRGARVCALTHPGCTTIEGIVLLILAYNQQMYLIGLEGQWEVVQILD